MVALFCLPWLLAIAPRIAPAATAVIFFLIYLGFMVRRIPKLGSEALKKKMEDADEPAPLILAITLVVAVIAIGSLFSALNREKSAEILEVLLAFSSVVFGWLAIHTMFAMHYAHLFWQPGEQEKGEPSGGLDFPETPEPGAYDFLYFSFVIGMTAQTSDVAITTTAMRRINLAHSVMAFFFNTVLVAACVNAVVSLAG